MKPFPYSQTAKFFYPLILNKYSRWKTKWDQWERAVESWNRAQEKAYKAYLEKEYGNIPW